MIDTWCSEWSEGETILNNFYLCTPNSKVNLHIGNSKLFPFIKKSNIIVKPKKSKFRFTTLPVEPEHNTFTSFSPEAQVMWISVIKLSSVVHSESDGLL